MTNMKVGPGHRPGYLPFTIVTGRVDRLGRVLVSFDVQTSGHEGRMWMDATRVKEGPKRGKS